MGFNIEIDSGLEWIARTIALFASENWNSGNATHSPLDADLMVDRISQIYWQNQTSIAWRAIVVPAARNQYLIQSRQNVVFECIICFANDEHVEHRHEAVVWLDIE